MGYFVATKDLNEHNDLLGNGKSIDHLKVWGKDLLVDNYVINNDGSVAFKGTPYSVTYKACLESGNFFFVPIESEEVKEVEQPKAVIVEKVELKTFENEDDDVQDVSTETLEDAIKAPKRRGPKKKNI